MKYVMVFLSVVTLFLMHTITCVAFLSEAAFVPSHTRLHLKEGKDYREWVYIVHGAGQHL